MEDSTYSKEVNASYDQGVQHLKAAWKLNAKDKMPEAISELKQAIIIFEQLEHWSGLVTAKISNYGNRKKAD